MAASRPYCGWSRVALTVSSSLLSRATSFSISIILSSRADDDELELFEFVNFLTQLLF